MRRETISAFRYGFGLSPNGRYPVTSAALIEEARTTADAGIRLTLDERTKVIFQNREARKKGDDAKKAAQRALQRQAAGDVRAYFRDAVTDGGFGARLVSFWVDHFTVAANGPVLRTLVADFVERAVRPNIVGTFPGMLRAAALHPAMLIYLNQVQSVGPNSRAGQRRDRGLNENLAREILELHTVGVGAGYSQADVRAFAGLLTGLSVDDGGFKYRPGISEPGPHQVLGKTYGAALGDIEDALTDIALRPDTAAHLARKLVLHFVGLSDPAFEARIADAYLTSKGDLAFTYAAMLDDDRAWESELHKAKPPFAFIVSALRAAGATGADVDKISRTDFRQGVFGAMQLMGQPLFQPPGPDGWDEAPETWITPTGIAARIRWATAFAERIEATHDPRAFLETALADAATPLLTFAVGGSESRVEGLALTLLSPEFNRR